MLENLEKGTHGAYMRLARIIGSLYLPVFVLAPFALLYVRSALVVPGDALMTATRILGNSSLFKAGAMVEIILILIDVILAPLLYLLFVRVSKPLALTAAFLRFGWAIIATISVIASFLALLLLSDPGYTQALGANQAQSLALLFLSLHEYIVAGVGFILFGLHIGVISYLILKSKVMPRGLGILLMVAAVGYLINSVATLLTMNSVPDALMAFLLLPAFLGELSLSLWLVVRGVRLDSKTG